MSKSVSQLFGMFVTTNGLQKENDFHAHTIYYTGLWEGWLSRKEAIGSIDFTGFVDGYNRRTHRYKGPVGSLDTDTLGNDVYEICKLYIESRGSNIDETRKESIRDFSGSALEETDEYRYDKQYRLGRSMRESLPLFGEFG